MIGSSRPARWASRGLGSLAFACALFGCVALFDFDKYDDARSVVVLDAAVAPAKDPFLLRVSPNEISGVSGDKIGVRIAIERSADFADAISIGIGGAADVSLLSVVVPAGASEADATIVLGGKHGVLRANLAATSPAYPGFTSVAPLAIIVRGTPGTLDNSFAEDGVLDADDFTLFTDVGTVPGEGLVVVGTASKSGALTLVRVAADGAVDPAFGTNGRASVRVPAGDGVAGGGCLATAADGRTWVGFTSASATWLTRTGTGGSADTTFGDGGLMSLATDGCRSIHGLADGAVLVVGEHSVVRATSQGGPDLSYGDGGRALDDVDGGLGGALVDPSSAAIVIASLAGTSDGAFGTVDLSSQGASGPRQAIPVGERRCRTLRPVRPARLADARVVVGGTCDAAAGQLDPTTPEVILAALVDGGVDPSFGASGFVTPQGFAELGAMVASGAGFVHAARRSEGAAPMVIEAHAASGATTWSFASTGTPLDRATPRAMAVDVRGRILVVGSRDVGVGPHAFAARFWP